MWGEKEEIGLVVDKRITQVKSYMYIVSWAQINVGTQ